jgi:hypothetical protein
MSPSSADPAVPAAAILAGIRERSAARTKIGGMGADPADARRLLAAVEIALQLHYPVIADAERRTYECSECRPSGTGNWPCLTVQAVTAALKAGSDG